MEIPDKATTIGNYAFYDSDALETVTMTDSVTSLGNYAFSSCEKLANVTLSKNLTKIPSYCFSDCPALAEIELPHGLFSGVTTVDANAFKNCTSLVKVTIPVTVTSIGSEAFSYPQKTVIYGCKGSYAETYANSGGFRFVDNTKHITGIALKDNDAETVVVTRGYTVVPEFDYLPADTTDVLALKSNNTSIVTIKNLSQIYGNNNGSATVTATTSGGMDYTFNVLVHTLNSITLTPPAKLTYNYGEALDTAGLTVTANYSDGTSEPVTSYTVSGYNPETYGTQTVKVTYLNRSATFTVEVLDTRVKLTGIAVTTPPTKTAYEKGEVFDPTGIVVTGTYSDGSTAPVTGYAISAMNTLKTGTQTLTVSYEGFTDTFTVTVFAPHVHDYQAAVTTEPTCTAEGVRTYTCSACGHSYTETIAKTAHTPQTVTESATCTAEGRQYTKCAVCGEILSEVTVLPKTDHTYNAAVTKEATCKEEGVRTYTCSGCGRSYTEAIAKLAHTPQTVTEPATCTAEGRQYTKCSVCGETLSDVTVLPKTDHVGKPVRIEPTCTAAGAEYTVCKFCGESMSAVTELPALGHSFGAWVTVTEPTTEADGLKERTCGRCGAKETEVLPKIPTKTVEDAGSGISLTYPETAYDGVVELKIEQVFDGAAFNMVDLNSEKNVVFDVTTVKDGVAVQPSGRVTLRIPVPADFDPAKCMVYHVSTETGRLEKMNARYENGCMVFTTDHFSVYAIVIEKPVPPTIAIRNYTENKTVDYRTTITFSVDPVQNPVDSAQVHWFVNNQDKGTGETYTVSDAKASYTVQVKYMKDGEVLAESPVEKVNVKTGFFAKLKAFFRSLFGRLPKQVQEVYDIEPWLSLLP